MKNLEYLYDFKNLSENDGLFTNTNKKVVSEYKIETPKNIAIDEINALTSKTYSFKCNNKRTAKIKIISKF